MKVAIVDMGLNARDRFGTTERGICELSNSLVQEGHEVLVLYRNHIHGDYLFPLNTQVKRRCISGSSAKLSGFMKVKREILRIFDAEKARKMTRAFKRDAYESELSLALNSFKPDMVICDSSLDLSLIDNINKTTDLILLKDKACANLYKEDECNSHSAREDRNSTIYNISSPVDELLILSER